MIAVAVTIVACIIAFILGAPDKWLAAIYCTVVTFTGTISYFRNRRGSERFWITIAVLFLFHIALTWFAIILRHTFDVGLVACLPFIFMESFFFYHLVRLAGEPRLLRTDERK